MKVLLASLAAVSLAAGGWATITPDPLPEQISVGAKVPLNFLIKQHGVTPLAGLKPTVLINQGDEAPTKFSAGEGKAKGWYTATLSFAKPGDWHITIESGFGKSKTTMPIQKVVGRVVTQ
jgi:hypothetical protein